MAWYTRFVWHELIIINHLKLNRWNCIIQASMNPFIIILKMVICIQIIVYIWKRTDILYFFVSKISSYPSCILTHQNYFLSLWFISPSHFFLYCFRLRLVTSRSSKLFKYIFEKYVIKYKLFDKSFVNYFLLTEWFIAATTSVNETINNLT